MDDQLLNKLLLGLARIVLSLESDLLELKASVVLLKQAVANLEGRDLQAALDDFRDREATVLKDVKASQQLRELREIYDLLQQHARDIGKHEA